MLISSGQTKATGAGQQSASTKAQGNTAAGSSTQAANAPGAQPGAGVATTGLTTEADVFMSALENVDALQQMISGMYR